MKYYCGQLGISQTQLALRCECGEDIIEDIESGKKKPSFDMIIKIADALKISPADLFVRDVSKSKIELKNALKIDFDTILARL